MTNSTPRILRTAAWVYLAPRVTLGVFLLAILGLGAFLIFVQVAIVTLQRLSG